MRRPEGRLDFLPPLALYVHVPWCLKKCPYCDFNSHASIGQIPENDYLAALIADLEGALPQIWNRPVISIFIGGGTPSLLSNAGLDHLLSAIRARLPLSPTAEITIEANPGAIDSAKFSGYRDAGVTRLSLGIQSFDDRKLRALGRIHSADDARRAAESALRHFERVNFDLMYALPEQSLEEARHDLECAVSLGPGHVSAYHLTLEPHTPYYQSPPPLPDEDLAADMQDMVERTLSGAGYAHYEISAYARQGQRCVHNLNYWTYGDYLGIGAGAHSKLSFPERIIREARHKHPDRYRQAPTQLTQSDEVTVADRTGEFMMNGLRLVEGIPARLYFERTGLPLQTIAPLCQRAGDDGLLTATADLVRPTVLGRRHLNRLIGYFI